ncbi:hypothetical protein AB9E29_33730, partial [Rhizobium leguminosarum]|uniref:hypothetical protein n=1 Tax=Rhizobium leguminosarum TaxID=384 RepID=UPI003F95E799
MLKIISFKWDINFTGIFCRVLWCVAQKHVLHCGISRSSSKVTGLPGFVADMLVSADANTRAGKF